MSTRIIGVCHQALLSFLTLSFCSGFALLWRCVWVSVHEWLCRSDNLHNWSSASTVWFMGARNLTQFSSLLVSLLAEPPHQYCFLFFGDQILLCSPGQPWSSFPGVPGIRSQACATWTVGSLAFCVLFFVCRACVFHVARKKVNILLLNYIQPFLNSFCFHCLRYCIM